jgi:YegS/Rv2252/BmrU family lipid kinase
MEKRKFLFIVNPISGGIKKDRWIKELRKELNARQMNAEIEFPSSGLDTQTIASQSVVAGIDTLVACGGDGTINDIARKIVSTETALGIIPLGSGNGFARALKISFNLSESLDLVQKGSIQNLDSGLVNERFFMNIAGFGFDAHIAGLFQGSKRRGLSTYAKLTLQAYWKYKPESYRIVTDGVRSERKSFFSAVCNGSQFGNEFTVAPRADLMDGLLELIEVDKPGVMQVPLLALNALQRRFDKNKLVQSANGRTFTIERLRAGLVNIDGEPEMMENILHFSVNPGSLPVICRQ